MKDDILEDVATSFLVIAVACKVVVKEGEDAPSTLKDEDKILHFITTGGNYNFSMK